MMVAVNIVKKLSKGYKGDQVADLRVSIMRVREEGLRSFDSLKRSGNYMYHLL
jgi:hypothetical protein